MARTTSSPGIAAEPPAQVAHGARRRPLVVSLLLSLRPDQWTKNLLVFAGLLFGRRLSDTGAIVAAIVAFAVFCLLSGVVYILNDISDRESDRRRHGTSHDPFRIRFGRSD